MAIILDDISHKAAFYPFTNVRSLADMRMGIFTFSERWSVSTMDSIYVLSEVGKEDGYNLNEIFPANVLMGHGSEKEKHIELKNPWEIITNNAFAIREDFKLIAHKRSSLKLSLTNNIINEPDIFVEKGVKAEFVTFNASEGPIYIGKNVEIMEGTLIRGPVAICEGAVIKLGSKIYGGTTIGPWCVAGGEIKNSILTKYSNKSHDGYLGDSILGEWCNLGAGTSNSNVKNTAGIINIWNNETQSFNQNGVKCGLLMGDYSRTAINTSFNTGTVVGTCCNIFGNEVPPKYIRDFTWGKESYQLEKAFKDIENWKKLKSKYFTEKEKQALQKIYPN